MYEESIYNLIPKEYVPPPKQSKYKSRHNPRMPPTGSTFINYSTSRPGVRFPIAWSDSNRWRMWEARPRHSKALTPIRARPPPWAS